MWFITVMEKMEQNKFYGAEVGYKRTWGYYSSKERALKVLHENQTDLWETCYDYAVLEKFGEGICPDAEEEIWFKYDRSRNGYFEIDKPDCVVNLCNWGIG